MAARYSHKSGYTVTKRQTVRRPTMQITKRTFKFGPTTAKFFGLAVLAILAAVMVAQSSSNATTAYKQNEIRQEIGHTEQDVERLQLEAKRAQSLQAVQNTAIKDQLENTTRTDPVEMGDVAGVSTAKP